MRRRPPRSTRTDTLFPYTPLFRSLVVALLFLRRSWPSDLEGTAETKLRQPPELFRRLAPLGEAVRGRVHALRWPAAAVRSEEHTSELQSLMRISYAVFCLHKKTTKPHTSDKNTDNFGIV